MNDEQLAADLRRALEQQAAAHQPSAGAWARIDRRLRRQPLRRGLLAVAPVLAAAVVVALVPAAREVLSPPARGVSPGQAFAAARPAANPAWRVPATYQQACADESTVCKNVPKGAIPAALDRPLHFPALAPGQACPATTGKRVRTPEFSGVALGRGPVRLIVGAASAKTARRGLALLLRRTSVRGWHGFTTLWFSEPWYHGPILIRADKLGGRGPVAMGSVPNQAPLIVPPGATLVSGRGYREVAGGAWVKGPGCYAWQVDGLTFSEIIVVRAAY